MRWQFALAVSTVAFSWTIPSRAAIFLDAGPPMSLDSGLFSRTVTAISTQGERIAGFDSIRLTNAHQVWGLGDQPTIRPPFPGFGWNDAWELYDSHLITPPEQILGSVGAPLTETNDKVTTGILCLPQEFDMDPPSGFGTLASASGSDAFRLLPQFHSESVPFMQVVGTVLGAQLEVTVAFSDANGQPGEAAFLSFDLGVHAATPLGDVPDLNPLVVDAVFDVMSPQPLSIQLEAVDQETAAENLLWSDLLYCRGPGMDPLFPDAMDAELSADGQFSWNPLGWRDGAHLFHATVRDEDNNRCRGLALTVNLQIVPEPASGLLYGLAGIALCALRCRSLQKG
jgi:hypothetical protein